MAEKLTTRIEAFAEAPEQAKEAASTVEAASQQPQTEAAPAPAEQQAGAKPEGSFARASQWFDQTFPHSKNAVIGGLAGLVVALLLFSIGLLKTLVIAILVLVGVAAGQYLDGDPKLVKAIQNLMKKR